MDKARIQYKWYKRGQRMKKRYGSHTYYSLKISCIQELPEQFTSEYYAFCDGYNSC